ncbi:glutamate ABC transporter substrate-binding protein [Streptomyces sp. ML-6]|uniref:glutamate ABC transporter substrate-binding protein n=1 Tax=Streptomyces sp. ML-6 TaxID=2982693 RepID=UPI0024C05E2B|nr:glutamate ABC transporter substrate-binding protein [Streptomyces sp. ML-6]MDK0519502.1 glutamate ABC transporter substrate-binding protein [Streptomyces sp. ML-6]
MTRKRTTGNAVGRLRGWGGVTGMAAACAVTASFTLLPLLLGGPGAAADASAGVPGTTATTHVTQARAADCTTDPWASVSPADAADDKVGEIRARGQLIVGVDQNSLFWASRDPESEENEIVGFDIDLARAIAADLLPDVAEEERVVFRVISTADREKMLESGDIDLVVRTMSINCEKNVSFSHPYFEAAQQIIAAKDTKGIDGLDSLTGKRVCTADGSSARTAVRAKVAEKDQVHVPNQLDCLARLQLGEVDAVVTDDTLAAAQVAQDPAIEFKGAPFTEEYYGVAARKQGASDLVARVNRVLADYSRDGRWTDSYKKWLKERLPGKKPPVKPASGSN